MARHHTKDKGDLGVAKAHADLAAKGYLVLFPTTEHAPFDLVAHKIDDGTFVRVQVKYRRARPCGSIYVEFKGSWSDRAGVHTVLIDKSAIDVFCVYCPDTDECYYLRPDRYGHSVTLRILPSRNNQRSRIWMAADFRELPPLVDAPALISEQGVLFSGS